MKDINCQLNIFTNCHASSPDIGIVLQTYNSFINTFGPMSATIYIDPNPHNSRYVEYCNRLRTIPNCTVVKTESLSDGYVKSIKNSTADYLFQLEGDWIFNDNINHSLRQIIKFMSATGCYHFRFNKRSNFVSGWDKMMCESEFMGIKYCVSNNISNNPHIIDRKKYLNEFIDYIKIVQGSKGIEEQLNKYELSTCIYGGHGHDATIKHLDGRH